MRTKGMLPLLILLFISIFAINLFAGWPQTSKVTADSRIKSGLFGREVDISKDWAIVGDDRYHSINGTDTLKNVGRAYIYHRDTATNTWSLFQTLSSVSNQEWASFGNAVAISGKYAFVGSHSEDVNPGEATEKTNIGAVYVYELKDTLSAGVVWIYRQKLQESDIEVDEYFGRELSADDNVMAVGVPQADNEAGAIYLYKRGSNGLWALKKRFDGSLSIPPNFVLNNGTQLGYSVDINGQSLVAGMPGYENSSGDSTYAALGVWFEEDTTYTNYRFGLITPDDFSGMEDPVGFGHSVAVYDDDDNYTNGTPRSYVAIGANGDKQGSNSYGAVYLYTYLEYTGTIAYRKHSLLRNTVSGTQGGRFGYDVDIDGNTVAISSLADNYKLDGKWITSYGGAFIYSFWGKNLEYAVHANDAVQYDQFGRSIAVDYRSLFVGASSQDFNALGTDSIRDAGAAYFFYNNRDFFPEVADSIPNLEVFEDNHPIKYVDLNSVFIDYSSSAYNTTADLVYTVSVDTALLTAEVSIDDTLLLSFPENANGYVNVTVTATDTAGQTAKETFGVRIVPQNDAPEFNTPVTDAKEEDAYSFTNIASDIDGNIVDIEVLGTLPSWLTLNKERVLSDYSVRKENFTYDFNYSNSFTLDIDENGNLYFQSDYDIWKAQSNGNAFKYAGNYRGYKDGLADTAQFESNARLTVDKYGNVYVADYGNNVIRKIDTNHVVTTIAGDGTSGYVDGNGTSAQFSGPCDLILDSLGNIYVADAFNGYIRKIDTNGNVTTITANGELRQPDALAWLNSTELVVLDGTNIIKKINVNDGTVDTIAGTGSVGHANNADPLLATFNQPEAVVVDSLGNIYVADVSNKLIRKIGTDGVTTYAGKYGANSQVFGSVDSASFNDYPRSLAIDGVGNIYISYQYSDFNLIHYEYSLTGIPTITDVGAHEVSLITRDPYGLTDTITFTINVDNINDAPVMTTVRDTTINEDTELEVLLSMTDASDIDGDDLAVVLLIGSNYTVNGAVVKPDTNYNGPLTIGVAFTDGEFNTDTIDMTITVAAVNDKPIVTSANTASAKEDVMFAYTATATDVESTPDISFGYKPSWMSVNGAIVLGTPLVGGDTSFSIIAFDGELSDTLIVNVSVADSNDAPIVNTPMEDYTVEQGVVTSVLLPIDQFTDIDDDALTVTVTGLPTGVTLVNDAIEGTFASIDTYTVIFTATDPSGLAVSDTIVIIVDPITSIFEVDEDHHSVNLAAYPNPVSQSDNHVSIFIPESFSGEGTISIYDILGHELDFQEVFIMGDMTFHWDLRNRSGLKVGSGIYTVLVKIRKDNGDFLTKKISIGVKE